MLPKLVSQGLLLLQLCAGLTAAQDSSPLYKDPNADIEDRVADLLGRMTVEDKMAQLIQGALYLYCHLQLTFRRAIGLHPL
jgi:beta-glucosidase